MVIKEIEGFLAESLEDHRLSRSERKALKQVFADALQDPKSSAGWLQQRAFALAKNELTDQRSRQVLDWLEGVVKTLAAQTRPETKKAVCEAHFSPGDDCLNRIVQSLKQCRKSADICVFTITDDRISRQIVAAQKRGVAIRLISDDDKAHDRGSDVIDLAKAGIPVRIDKTPHHMHHKFAIFDQKILLSGSYNWTRSAQRSNEENILLTDEPKLIAAFTREFEKLWSKFGAE